MKVSNSDVFETRVRRSEECWEWAGAHTKAGYSQLWNQNAMVYAHRFAYEHYIARIPDGHEVHHTCRNRGCVNPAHLEAVTHKNNTRSTGRATWTHCERGHDWSVPANVYHHADGTRKCRACHLERCRTYRQRRKETA